MERAEIRDFLIGFSLGATTGLLLAPCTGKQVRSRITEAATDGPAYLKQRGGKLRDAVLGVVEQRKREIARHKEGVAEAIRQGSRAYKRAVTSSRLQVSAVD